jgi:hypothetical protein
VGTRDDDNGLPGAHTDANASQVIPAVELTGSRGEQLKTLDALIARLVRLRRGLAGDTDDRKLAWERHGRYIDSPDWPWFLAGTSAGALIVLLLVLARSCA